MSYFLGCDDEGVCRPVAYKKVTPTCLSYECRFNKEFKDSFFTLAGGGKCAYFFIPYHFKRPGPKVIKLFSCSTQLSAKLNFVLSGVEYEKNV